MPLRSRPTASSPPHANSPTPTSTWCWIAKEEIDEDSCCHQSHKKDTNISSERHWVNEWLTRNPFSDASTVSNSKTSLVAASPDQYGSVRSQTQELAAPSPSRASDASGNASPRAEWSNNVTPRRRPAELFLPSSSTRHGSRSPGSSEPGYTALEVALDLVRAPSASSLDLVDIEVARDNARSADNASSADNARAVRYKSVEGLLLFLDAQAEHRVSSSSS